MVESVILHKDPEDMDDTIDIQQNKLNQVRVLLNIVDGRLSRTYAVISSRWLGQ